MITTELTEIVSVLQDKELKEIGFDIETSGLNVFEDKILLIQLATYKDTYTIIPDKWENRIIKYVMELIAGRNLLVIGHNLKFDMKFIYHNYGVLFTNTFDTMLAEILSFIGAGSIYVSLQTLCKKYLHIKLDKDIRESFYNKLDTEFTAEQIEYAEKDAQVLLQLRPLLDNVLKTRGQYHTWKMEMKLLPVVTMMEHTGIILDRGKWTDAGNKAKEIVIDSKNDLYATLEANFDKYAGKYKNALDVFRNIKYPVDTAFRVAEKKRLENVIIKDEIKAEVIPLINFGSYKQAKHVLNKLGVPVNTTNAKELAAFEGSHPIVEFMLNYRKGKKRETSFGNEFLKHINPTTNAVHTNFNQLGTATGRFSSDEPNLQNIVAEEEYRSPFVARDGYLLATCDYSNIELRIIGEASKEPKFIEAFKKGQDLHRVTGSLIFNVPYGSVTKEHRKIGKHLNFAVVYGTSAKGMSYNFRIPEEDAKKYLDSYFTQYNELKFFITKFGESCLRKGFSVTLGGRRRFLSFILNPKGREQFKELSKARRQAVNHLPQGTSADMVKLALIYLFYENPFGWENLRPLLTVHDEIVVEFRAEIKEKAEEFIHTCLNRAGCEYLKIIPEAHEVIIDTHWRK